MPNNNSGKVELTREQFVMLAIPITNALANDGIDRMQAAIIASNLVDAQTTNVQKVISSKVNEAVIKELERFLAYDVVTHMGGLQKARSVSVKKLEDRIRTLKEKK